MAQAISGSSSSKSLVWGAGDAAFQQLSDVSRQLARLGSPPSRFRHAIIKPIDTWINLDLLFLVPRMRLGRPLLAAQGPAFLLAGLHQEATPKIERSDSQAGMGRAGSGTAKTRHADAGLVRLSSINEFRGGNFGFFDDNSCGFSDCFRGGRPAPNQGGFWHLEGRKGQFHGQRSCLTPSVVRPPLLR